MGLPGACRCCRPVRLRLRALVTCTTAIAMSGTMGANALATPAPMLTGSSVSAVSGTERPDALPLRQAVLPRQRSGVSRDATTTLPISAVGRPATGVVNYGTNAISITGSSRRLGDLLTLSLYTYGEGSPAPSSVGGGGVTTWHRGVGFLGYATDANLSIWWGVVTSTGRSQVTAHFVHQPGGGIGVVREFAAAKGASWYLTGSGHSTSRNSTVTFPTLGTTAGRALYLGYAFTPGAPLARSNGPIRYATQLSPRGNSIICTETDLKRPVAPAANQTRDNSDSVATLFVATTHHSRTEPAQPETSYVTTTTRSTTSRQTTTSRPTSNGKDNPSSKTTMVTPRPTSISGTANTHKPVPGDLPVSWSPHDIFREEVGSWPLDPMSRTFAADIVSDYETDYGSVGVNRMPFYTVPANQPNVPISVLPGCRDFLVSTGTNIPIPPYAQLAGGSTGNPLLVFQPSTHTDWELWRAIRNADGSYSACWGGKLDTATADGVFPDGYGLAATGISYLALIITEGDVASGRIDHAIALQIPRCNHYVYPADRGDCNIDPGQPGEGQWFRLPSDLQMPAGLTPFAQMVFTALQRYGAVVSDFSNAVMTVAEQSSDWAVQGHAGVDPITRSWAGEPEYKVIANLPWEDLQAVVPQ
jgi:hypothetical protein